MAEVLVKLLQPAKYIGQVERVKASRIKGKCEVGTIVRVKYKSGLRKAEVLDMFDNKRRRLSSSSADESDDDLPLSKLARRLSSKPQHLTSTSMPDEVLPQPSSPTVLSPSSTPSPPLPLPDEVLPQPSSPTALSSSSTPSPPLPLPDDVLPQPSSPTASSSTPQLSPTPMPSDESSQLLSLPPTPPLAPPSLSPTSQPSPQVHEQPSMLPQQPACQPLSPPLNQTRQRHRDSLPLLSPLDFSFDGLSEFLPLDQTVSSQSSDPLRRELAKISSNQRMILQLMASILDEQRHTRRLLQTAREAYDNELQSYDNASPPFNTTVQGSSTNRGEHVSRQMSMIDEPIFAAVDGEDAILGRPDSGVAIPKEKYLRALARSSGSGRKLVLKLMDVVFSKETMMKSNLTGGRFWSKNEFVDKEMLDPKIIEALTLQAQLQFPGYLTNEQQKADLRRSMNDKCRHVK